MILKFLKIEYYGLKDSNDKTHRLPNQKRSDGFDSPVEYLVYARHGRELMG